MPRLITFDAMRSGSQTWYEDAVTGAIVQVKPGDAVPARLIADTEQYTAQGVATVSGDEDGGDGKIETITARMQALMAAVSPLDEGEPSTWALADMIEKIQLLHAYDHDARAVFLELPPNPSVESTSPSPGEGLIPAGQVFSVTFDERMDPATVDETTVFLVAEDGSAADVATTAVDLDATGTVATLTLDGDLTLDRAYRVKVTTDVKDLVGNAIGETYMGPSVRVLASLVHVVSTSPANGDRGVLVGAEITVTFDTARDPEDIDETTIYLVDVNGDPADVATVSVALDETLTVATLTLDGPLTDGVRYKTHVAAEATGDEAYQQAQGWITSSASDVVAPYVVSMTPADEATGVYPNAVVSVTFSEAMDVATMIPSRFSVDRVAGHGYDDRTVTGVAMSAGNTVATLTMNAPFSNGIAYRVSVRVEALDANGNAITTNDGVGSNWVQPTGFAVEAATGVTYSPADEATGVAVNAPLTVTFSRAVDPETVDETTIRLVDSNGNPADVATVSVALSVGNTVATLTMDDNLTAGTVYKISVVSVTDIHGGSCTSQQANGFTTAS